MTRYTPEFGPNVEQILCQATRVVRGTIPARVRAELRAAVKAGALGHLKKDGLKPKFSSTRTTRTARKNFRRVRPRIQWRALPPSSPLSQLSSGLTRPSPH